jgi:hypothetical protein
LTGLADHFDRLGKIFVAGTGRSGTSVLHYLLGHHPDAYLVPFESKFIVEGDGLNALIPSLTDNFSVNASDLAFIRFIEMMDGELPGVVTAAPEQNMHYAERIGSEYYFPPLIEYLESLTDFRLNGWPFPRHFEDRGELIALTRRLVARMFGAPALAARKAFWVEKTPTNIIAMDLLWEIFPEAVIVHIKRDPRGVLHSFMEQEWSPREIEPATRYLAHIYWRWMKLKSRLDVAGRRYLEIKLEDLRDNPALTMEGVANVAGISPDFRLQDVRQEPIDRWKSEMQPEHRRHCEHELSQYFELMGYEI